MRVLSFEISAKYLKALLFEQGEAFPFLQPVYTRNEDTTSICEERKTCQHTSLNWHLSM